MSALPQKRPASTRAGLAQPLSFDAVYRAHARLVARWAHRLGGPDVDTDEAVQEVFLTVARRLASFRGEAQVTTWLFRITARAVANQRRALRRRWRRWAILAPRIAEQVASASPGPAEHLEEREAAARFYRVLDELPERYRNVLVLFELEELSGDEIGVLVERPPTTVRVWLHRARAEFTRRWRDHVAKDDHPRREPATRRPR